MKKLLACVAATILAFTTTGANADDSPWYIGAFGGANWMDGDDSTFVLATDVEFETGRTVGGVLGHKFENSIRAEVELAYRDNGVFK